MTTDWIPTKEDNMAELCGQWLDVLETPENLTTYHIDKDDAEEVIAKINLFLSAWEAFSTIDSTVNRNAKNEAKKNAASAMRKFASSSLRYNSHVDDTLRAFFGLKPGDSARTPHPRPTSQPLTAIEATGNNYEHRIKAINRDTHNATKPADAYGVRYAWKLGGEKPASGDDLTKTRFSRRTDQIINFTEAEAEQRVWYATCYENAKGETGPWSPIVEARVW